MTLYYRKRTRTFLLFLLLPCSILSLIITIPLKISPLFLKLSEDKVYSIAFEVTNNIVSNELTKISPEELIEYKYSSDGNISSINANLIGINKLSTNISQSVSKSLSLLDNIYIELPVGSFINDKFLAGIGPKIPIKIILLNNVNTTYSSDFYSTGINQTCHKILMTINCNLRVLSKLAKKDLIVTVDIPIIETIIVGDVPNTYFELKK